MSRDTVAHTVAHAVARESKKISDSSQKKLLTRVLEMFFDQSPKIIFWLKSEKFVWLESKFSFDSNLNFFRLEYENFCLTRV